MYDITEYSDICFRRLRPQSHPLATYISYIVHASSPQPTAPLSSTSSVVPTPLLRYRCAKPVYVNVDNPES